MDARSFMKLVAIGVQANIPMHLQGMPGAGKTKNIEALARAFTDQGINARCYTLIGSIREPQDFGGFPVQTPEGVRLAPMQWAREANDYAQRGYLVLIFLDELTTVPPTTQAAMLRLLTDGVVGELELHPNVRFIAASNAVDWAAGGQELQPPMANRMWHGDFPLDHEQWCDGIVQDFPPLKDIPILPKEWEKKYSHAARLMVASYIKSKGRNSLLAPPEDASKRSGPWPSPRTWTMAAKFMAAIESVGGGRDLEGMALAGLVGQGEALAFLSYRDELDLQDPEEILANPRAFKIPDRSDRAYATCHSIFGAIIQNKTPKRWEAALIALGTAAKNRPDIPAAVARLLCEKPNRPDKMPKLPEECRPFLKLMVDAGLIPKE